MRAVPSSFYLIKSSKLPSHSAVLLSGLSIFVTQFCQPIKRKEVGPTLLLSTGKNRVFHLESRYIFHLWAISGHCNLVFANAS